MDVSTLIGIVMGMGLVVWGIGTSKLGNFVDFQSLAIVLGGTIAAVLASYPVRILKDIPKQLMVLTRHHIIHLFFQHGTHLVRVVSIYNHQNTLF